MNSDCSKCTQAVTTYTQTTGTSLVSDSSSYNKFAWSVFIKSCPWCQRVWNKRRMTAHSCLQSHSDLFLNEATIQREIRTSETNIYDMGIKPKCSCFWVSCSKGENNIGIWKLCLWSNLKQSFPMKTSRHNSPPCLLVLIGSRQHNLWRTPNCDRGTGANHAPITISDSSIFQLHKKTSLFVQHK